MKTTGRRSLILYILGAAFLFGLGVFLYGFATQGGMWAVQPFNKYITTGVSSQGKILDRNGTVLAESKNGKRVYSSDETTRRAMLHAVGDTTGYISTGVQYNYRAELSGYNGIMGLVTPNGKAGGDDITLTLDSSLCRLAKKELGSRNGAVAVYNYKTGEMLCMVSTPDFDPENVPSDINTNSKYKGAYLNKVMSAQYTPGSIFKVVTAAAAIENFSDIDSRTWDCSGSITVNGNKITDIKAYGRLHFKDALAKSSNVAFAEMAMELGTEKMTAEANAMGFNSSFSLDGINASKSVYNVDGAEKNELGWSGVGQYTDLASPYHMLVLMGAVANGGTPVMPYIIKNITTPYGTALKSGAAQAGSRLVKAETAERLQRYMRYNVTNAYGDGLFPGLNVCAKTGTAEVGGGKKPNCWMVGYSLNTDTPLAFAVVVEEQSYSIRSAGKVASSVMKAAAKIK